MTTLTDQTSEPTAPPADATTPTSATEVLREWKNPTDREVVFLHDRETGLFLHEIDENHPHEIRVPPGGIVKLLSRWDHAVQILACQDARCEGKRCSAPTEHRGITVMGGLAPQLVRLDLPGAMLHPGLVTPPLGPSKPAAVEEDIIAAARRRKRGST